MAHVAGETIRLFSASMALSAKLSNSGLSFKKSKFVNMDILLKRAKLTETTLP
jgi:hypothetical protein